MRADRRESMKPALILRQAQDEAEPFYKTTLTASLSRFGGLTVRPLGGGTPSAFRLKDERLRDIFGLFRLARQVIIQFLFFTADRRQAVFLHL